MAHEVWYAIPSANVQRAEKCFDLWRVHGCKIAVAINKGDPAPRADLVLELDPYPGYFTAVNLLSQAILREHNPDIVITGGDDMYPDPRYRADVLAEEFFLRFPDGYGVMQPTGDSGDVPWCGSPWMGRGWLERAYDGTGPFHGGYFHFHGDIELKSVAQAQNALWLRPEVSQFHDHWTRSGQQPTVYQARWARERKAADDRLLETRKKGWSAGRPDGSTFYPIITCASSGHLELACNLLESARRCGIDRWVTVFTFDADVHVGLADFLRETSNTAQVESWPVVESNSDYGTLIYANLMLQKLLIMEAHCKHPRFLYVDADCVFARSPFTESPDPHAALMAQSERLDFGRPSVFELCAGALLCTSACPPIFRRAVLDLEKWMMDVRAGLSIDPGVAGDQINIQRALDTLKSKWSALPPALWLNGARPWPRPEAENQPVLLHANWTIGTAAKKKKLLDNGRWLLPSVMTTQELEQLARTPQPAFTPVVAPVLPTKKRRLPIPMGGLRHKPWQRRP